MLGFRDPPRGLRSLRNTRPRGRALPLLGPGGESHRFQGSGPGGALRPNGPLGQIHLLSLRQYTTSLWFPQLLSRPPSVDLDRRVALELSGFPWSFELYSPNYFF